MFASVVGSASSPASCRATCIAQTLAWAFAENADFGMGAPMIASPITCTCGCSVEAKLTGSTGHQPVALTTPARAAMAPACCGGTTFATSARTSSKSVYSVMLAASTRFTRPSSAALRHCTIPS